MGPGYPRGYRPARRQPVLLPPLSGNCRRLGEAPPTHRHRSPCSNTFAAVQLVAQLVVFPIGRGWARVIPNVKIFGHSLNGGPFTIKEHVSVHLRSCECRLRTPLQVLVTIMAGVGATSAYAVCLLALLIGMHADPAYIIPDGHRGRSAGLVPPTLQLRLRLAARHVHPANRVLHRRHRAPLPRLPALHE